MSKVTEQQAADALAAHYVKRIEECQQRALDAQRALDEAEADYTRDRIAVRAYYSAVEEQARLELLIKEGLPRAARDALSERADRGQAPAKE